MNSVEQAKKHAVVFEGPAPNFFEGALMGNGGLGVVVTTRPDAICLHIGHNNVWDIRISERNQEKIGTFQEVFEKFKQEGPESEWYKTYLKMARENYAEKYPRPFPCGTFMMLYDRRRAEVIQHSLDISNGVLTIQMLVEEKVYEIQIVISMAQDSIHIQIPQIEGRESLFWCTRFVGEKDLEHGIPLYEVMENTATSSIMRQIMPFAIDPEASTEVTHARDKAFAIRVKFNQEMQTTDRLGEHYSLKNEALEIEVALKEGLNLEAPHTQFGEELEDFEQVRESVRKAWEKYWGYSGILLEDEYLEQVWYRNQYFLRCTTHPEKNCPGLFGNWMKGNIGTAWHGDYHFNYNIQQPFWGTLSSNRIEENLSYVKLVEEMLPVSQKWAKEYYGLRGAFFPHTGYPVEMNTMPYPLPTWGWEVSETAWAVQGLWWHYLYTQDVELLRNRLFEPIKEAALFLIDYMMRPEAHGEAWGDDKYHVFPTVVPEIYGLTTQYEKNKDCIIDLTLNKFLFKAFMKACEDLGYNELYQEDIEKCQMILAHFPEYPTAESKRGKVFTTIEGENPEMVQNVPISPSPIFPGEDIGLGSDEESYKIAVQTWQNHRNEGGNELVFYNLQGARLGILNLERFKRQVKYCMLPNGTCTDKVLVTGGRYGEMTEFDFMARMGIWVENMGLPAVINECLIQGYDGCVRLFPNWPMDKSAKFHQLRVAGAFLVSSECSKGEVQSIQIQSEKGGTIKIKNPWQTKEAYLEIEMCAGESIELNKESIMTRGRKENE